MALFRFSYGQAWGIATLLAFVALHAAPLYAAQEADAAAQVAAKAAAHDAAVAKAAREVYHGDGIVVSDVFLREGDNCVSLTLTSKTEGLDALLSARTDIADKIVLIDQRMHRDVTKIELLPEKPLRLERGVACLILRGMKTQPKQGDVFSVDLTFDRAPAQTVVVKVVAAQSPVSTEKKDEKKPAPHSAASPVQPAVESPAEPSAEFEPKVNE